MANLIDKIINRRLGLPKEINKDVKIFVFQHFNVELPPCFDDGEVYIPIQGGGEGIDVLQDTESPSISEYNVYLNEMTQIYWIGKHYKQVGNPAYIGFAHYRRCLEWDPELLSSGVLIASMYVSRFSNRRFFIDCHGDYWLNKFMEEFRKKFIEDEYSDLEKFWESHCMYIANNFITDRESFMRYFSFVEKCLEICLTLLRDNIAEFESMTKSHRRQFSFVMERMTSYWIWHEKCQGRIKVVASRLRCYNIDNGMTSVR